jgi:hypothetical protein
MTVTTEMSLQELRLLCDERACVIGEANRIIARTSFDIIIRPQRDGYFDLLFPANEQFDLKHISLEALLARTEDLLGALGKEYGPDGKGLGEITVRLSAVHAHRNELKAEGKAETQGKRT